jgi:hypothetical protein
MYIVRWGNSVLCYVRTYVSNVFLLMVGMRTINTLHMEV